MPKRFDEVKHGSRPRRRSMNRLKKEIRRKGIKLESDYPFMPFNGLETVIVNSEKATISEYHVSAGWMVNKIGRDLSLQMVRTECSF